MPKNSVSRVYESTFLEPTALMYLLCLCFYFCTRITECSPWILMSWKSALSFPSRLDHRAAGWLGRKDPSPSQHPLGISSPGPLCHQQAIYIYFTFGSRTHSPSWVLTGAICPVFSSSQREDVCDTVVIWKSTLVAPRPGACTQLFYFWLRSLFSSRKSLIPVCVLGTLPWIHCTAPALATQIAYSNCTQRVLQREGKAWHDEERVSVVLCSPVCRLEHDTCYTSGIGGCEPSL